MSIDLPRSVRSRRDRNDIAPTIFASVYGTEVVPNSAAATVCGDRSLNVEMVLGGCACLGIVSDLYYVTFLRPTFSWTAGTF